MVAVDISARADQATEHWDNESRGSQSIAVSIAFTAVAAAFLSLRLWTRLAIVRNFGPEDWIIIAACILSVGNTVAVAFEVHYGQGHHINTLSIDSIVNILKVSRGLPVSHHQVQALTRNSPS